MKMIKYTVEIKDKEKPIYPKNINLGFNDFEILQWTENKEEAVYWNEYECAEWFAINYENANVVEIKRKEFKK